MSQQRREVTVSVCDFSYDDMEMPMADFIKMLAKALLAVSEPLRSSVVFRITTGYGDERTTISADYVRPETDEELDSRQRREASYKRDAEARERATYESLRKKYGLTAEER